LRFNSEPYTYRDTGKPAAARFASTLILSALDATATLRPAFLHCVDKADLLVLLLIRLKNILTNFAANTSMMSSNAPGKPMPEFGFAYCRRKQSFSLCCDPIPIKKR